MSAILRVKDKDGVVHDIPSIRGYSAYQLAVKHGYTGTEEEWLASITGVEGKSAYEVAVAEGYSGTKAEWLASLKGDKGDIGKSAYEVAVEEGFEGTKAEWLASLKGPKGDAGMISFNGRAGEVSPASGDYNADQITETDTRKFVSPTEKETWNGKVDNSGSIMTGTLVTGPFSSSAAKQVLNCIVSTTDLTAGTSELETGVLYIVYE